MTLSQSFDQAYHELVRAWERHDDLRRRGASFAELIDSQHALQDKRLKAARLRPGHYR